MKISMSIEKGDAIRLNIDIKRKQWAHKIIGITKEKKNIINQMIKEGKVKK